MGHQSCRSSCLSGYLQILINLSPGRLVASSSVLRLQIQEMQVSPMVLKQLQTCSEVQLHRDLQLHRSTLGHPAPVDQAHCYAASAVPSQDHVVHGLDQASARAPRQICTVTQSLFTTRSQFCLCLTYSGASYLNPAFGVSLLPLLLHSKYSF